LLLKIQDQHRADLEKLTGCYRMLLHPLRSPSRIIREPQTTDSDEYYAEEIKDPCTALKNSDDDRIVPRNILSFVADKHTKTTTEPAKRKS